MPSSSALPVEAVLKLVLDKSGAQQIQDFLDNHTKQWSQVEQIAGRIGQHVEGLSRTVLGLAGAAGVGGLLHNVMQTSEAGSNVALARGSVTGGAGTWHPFGQAMLAAQGKTGVAATDITAGIIQGLQSAGGTPGPQQAAIIGAMLAGYGQTVGLTPSQVASVVGPLLQSSHQTLNAGATSGVLASMQGGMWAFPGSQAAPMLGVTSQLTMMQALGVSGTKGVVSPNGIANLASAAASGNSLFRDPSTLANAAQGVSGGLQGAYTNPAAEAFMTMAGISYQDQRGGITRQNVSRIMAFATAQYGSGETRDMVLRSLFGGIPGADLLETFAPGSKGAAAMWSHPGQTPQQLLNTIGHAQKRTTPNATAQRAGGNLLNWFEKDNLHLALGAAGIAFGPKILGSVIGKGFGALGDAGASILGDSAAGFEAGGPLGAIAGAILGPLIFPDSIGGQSVPQGTYDSHAVSRVTALAKKKFGSGWKSHRNWMQQQIYGGPSIDVFGPGSAEDPKFNAGKSRQSAGQTLDLLLGDQWAPGASPVDKFSRAADKLSQAADKLGAGKFSSYPGGSSTVQAGLGTGQAAALGASNPGALEFVSLMNGGGGASAVSGLGSGSSFVSTAASGSGSGWQTCSLTWYDPALGGTNSASGRKDPHSPTASGTPYDPNAMACAAPPAYPFGTQIQFSYGGKTITCVVNDVGGGIQGSHFDLTRGAANALGMLSAGVVSAKFRVSGHASGPSSSGAGAGAGGGLVLAARGASAVTGGSAAGAGGAVMSAAGSALGAAGHGAAPVLHVHVNIDGREIRRSRVLLGHKA